MSVVKKLALVCYTLILTLLLNTAALAQDKAKKALPSNVEKVSFTGEKGFPLSGTFYKGSPKAAGVLMLHDCEHDSSSYTSLGTLFSQQGLNALAIDFRGVGESADKVFSKKLLKKSSKDMSEYKNKLLMLKSYWDKDILLAYQYLQSKLAKGSGISVVTSGCSAIQGVVIAEAYRVNSFILISPVMDYMEKERYKNLIDIPSFFISAIHDTNSYQTANELFMWNGDRRSAFLTYKGNRRGDNLFRGKDHLISSMSLWVGKNLHHVQAELDK